jgi:hypothetical protein
VSGMVDGPRYLVIVILALDVQDLLAQRSRRHWKRLGNPRFARNSPRLFDRSTGLERMGA